MTNPSSADERATWRCFHCDEVFTTTEAAIEHFGRTERQSPACQIDIAEYRRMEQRMLAYNEEDAEIHRQMHGRLSDHRLALIREEERGYSRGLEDAKKHPAELGLQAIPAAGAAQVPVLSIKKSEWEVLSPEAQAKLLAITGAGTRNLQRSQAAAEIARVPLCRQPPEGWTCSRGESHEGPCASSPVGAAQVPSLSDDELQYGEALACLSSVMRAASHALVGMPPSEKEAKLRSVLEKAHDWYMAERDAIAALSQPSQHNKEEK